MITFKDIQDAHERIKPYIKETPIMTSRLLNNWIGKDIWFKVDSLQTTGSFKLRGATSFITKLLERAVKPKKIVANSSGNHAQAVAYAAAKFDIPTEIYAAKSISPVKAAATEYYGARLKTYDSREEADNAVQVESKKEGVVWIPPFNHQDIIAGQGTTAIEALTALSKNNIVPDATFAPCGGGGLLSGSFISCRALAPKCAVIGAEPEVANDASQSLQTGSIQSLTSTPNTLADGAATPSIGELTFEVIQNVDDFYEVNEEQIAYWTQWLQHLLKIHVEPTCAMTMAAVIAWIMDNPNSQNILVLLTGGNISQTNMQKIWSKDYLLQPPILTGSE